jgi:hypothetical protein
MGNAELPVGDTGSDCAVGRRTRKLRMMDLFATLALPVVSRRPLACIGDHKCIERTFSSSASLLPDAS